MKTIYLLFAIIIGIALTATPGYSAEKISQKKLLHVVSFKFKDTATPEQIKQVEDSFRALKKKIREVKGLEWGTNISPEKMNKGYTHCWIVEFKNEKDRDAYLVHPDHKAFAANLGSVLADVFVFDFWAQK